MKKEQTEGTAAQLVLQKVYTKDASFEAPGAPEIFKEENWSPDINLELNTKNRTLGEHQHEVVLGVTVTAKLKDKVAFIAEVQQAGIFHIEGIAGTQLDQILGSYCPNTLYPFVRQEIAHMVTQGGFPQLLLTPINFDALYGQYLKKRETQAADKQSATAT